jgi:hypothetical protein
MQEGGGFGFEKLGQSIAFIFEQTANNIDNFSSSF